MSQRFLDPLHSGRVLLMDGAMGTELQRAGLRPGECGEPWNLTHPERVRAIHQAYVDAGAEVLLTNTFQANPVNLTRNGNEDHLVAICRKGIELARQAGAGYVLGDMGPIGEDTARYIRQVARALRGVDALLLETCSGDAISAALWSSHYGSATTPPPLLVSFTFLKTASGSLRPFDQFVAPERLARYARWGNVEALGVNCGRDIGMDEIIEIIRRYRYHTDLPLFARPNAGTPTRVGDRWVYPLTPGMMAERLPELLEAGVSMVGGCCGTTPEHIAAFRPVVDAWNAQHHRPAAP